MRDYFSNDDPIQEVGRRGVFRRLHSFEEDDEYNYEKEMKEYQRSISSMQNRNLNININSNSSLNRNQAYPNEQLSKMTVNFILILTVLIFILPFLMVIYMTTDITETISPSETYVKPLSIEKSLGSEIPELNDELDLLAFYKLTSIKFDEAGSIIALYTFDKRTVANWCNFTENDERFNGKANTLHINYDAIPIYSKEKLINGLMLRDFEYVKEYPTGSVYAINKDNGYSLFVLISENDIIYGVSGGRYQDLFGE